MAPSTPRLRLGNYEALLELATGGMATVYVARQIGAAGFERLVVVKRVHRHLLANHEFYTMFVDEARVASLIRHPNVAPVIDVVEAEGELFLVMEYIESTALSTLLKTSDKDATTRTRTPLAPALAVRVIADTLSGLHAAHEVVDMRGQHLEVVHRDVSPQNIVVGVDGTTRLIDFGVAKARHRVTETKSGSLKGKYGYMAPEQTRAQPIDRRADLFAVGVVLHETLTGKRLFSGENEFDTMRRVIEGEIPDPSSIVPGVPRALDAVVQKALQRDRDARFQSAPEFLDALEAALVPAPPREVAAFVLTHSGERIAQRRATLQAMMEGRLEPLRAGWPGADDEPATVPSTPASLGTEAKITATHDARPFYPRGGRGTKVAIISGLAGAASVAAIVGAVALFGNRGSSPGGPVVMGEPSRSSAAVVVVPPPATAPASATTDGVTLSVVADASIESLTARGMREVEIKGSRARLVVAPWTGPLEVTAVLQGGRAAHAVAAVDGTRDLRLAAPQAAAAPPVALPPATSAAASARKTPGVAPARTSELQSNPYETP